MAVSFDDLPFQPVDGCRFEPEEILAHVGRLLEGRGPLTGRRIVVSAGATREAVEASQ